MLAAAADLLDQGQLVNRLSVVVTAIALGVVMLPVFPTSEAMVPTAAVIAALGVVELFLAMRVSLDAALFRRLSRDAADDHLDVAAFDAALLALKLIPAGRAGLPIARRFAGAKRLLVIQATTFVLQVVLAIVGGLVMFFQLI